MRQFTWFCGSFCHQSLVMGLLGTGPRGATGSLGSTASVGAMRRCPANPGGGGGGGAGAPAMMQVMWRHLIPIAGVGTTASL